MPGETGPQRRPEPDLIPVTEPETKESHVPLTEEDIDRIERERRKIPPFVIPIPGESEENIIKRIEDLEK